MTKNYWGTDMRGDWIFVFGSNLAGRHGKGAALEAKQKWGAIYGQGIGLQGQSYGIPTKGKQLQVLSLTEIEGYIKDFLNFVEGNPQLTFYLTPIGTGLAGYTKEEIRNILKKYPKPKNIVMSDSWKEKSKNDL